MTKPCPMELGERAVRFVEAGESRHAVAVRLGLSLPVRHQDVGTLSQDGQCHAGQDRRSCFARDQGPAPEVGVSANRGRWRRDSAGPRQRACRTRPETGLPDDVELRAPRGQALQKKPSMELSRTVSPSPGGATGGRSIRFGSSLPASSSSMRTGQRPTCPLCAEGSQR